MGVGMPELTVPERVRCPTCRSAVPATMLWATGDACPSCLRPLHVPDRREMRKREPHGKGEAKHQAAATRSLRLADESAARGDYNDAVAWVQVLEATGEPLPKAYETKRQTWLLAMRAGRRDIRAD
jgi:hypothetical protein